MVNRYIGQPDGTGYQLGLTTRGSHYCHAYGCQHSSICGDTKENIVSLHSFLFDTILPIFSKIDPYFTR